MPTTTNTLKISAAVVIQGLIYRPGTIVQVPTALAHDLMRRGRAELAGDADGPVAVIIDPPNGGAPTPNTLPPTENNDKPAPAVVAADAPSLLGRSRPLPRDR
ncbi:hypothetical protein [Xylella fastidiosa]|uniref:hypothetical protein n=1 Tax=Xylella fastidiosa TaxID=2371 RepID=UPI001F1AC72F|nr:hypothetical protein [Xylella fastidiosa]UIN27387.1 hypothetical protein IUD23_08740 [Xylella fastidiosa subsp. morus]UIN27503.1 hypothetical protein IUD23_09355 [Xylella fastidiosa subsp. morus]UIT42759.1 hypothetical protein LZ758_08190 [Xylella fastidiosa subsp. morus]